MTRSSKLTLLIDAITNNRIWLNAAERESLNDLLKRFKHLFDGTLGTWNSAPYTVELKEGALPYHAKPFPIPKIHEHIFKLELERLCNIGVLKRVKRSAYLWASVIAPTYFRRRSLNLWTDLTMARPI